MTGQPRSSRAIAFFDGQNLYHAAKEAFGFHFPNYDPLKLARAICDERGWDLQQVRFYTGIPTASDDPKWHRFWQAKLAVLGRQGVFVFTRPLRYRTQYVSITPGLIHPVPTAEEKGIDVRIALDMIRLAHHGHYDVALTFSQDQDLSEVAAELRVIAHEQERWIKMASAFPVSSASRNRRGIERTDWIPIEREVYLRCLDRRDYRVSDSLTA